MVRVLTGDFNPRSPHGERPLSLPTIHGVSEISTHAPRTGSDRRRRASRQKARHFNPRSPHGERLTTDCLMRMTSRFQPTLPARGATCPAIKCRWSCSNFNPRSPHGERQLPNLRWWKSAYISTHAPRTGSDGCLAVADCTLQKFQPTLPARGATDGGHCANHGHFNFNPRSPHGERPKFGRCYDERILFQPTLPARGATVWCRCISFPTLISTHAPRTGSDLV